MKVDIEKYIGTDDALFHYTKTAVGKYIIDKKV